MLNRFRANVIIPLVRLYTLDYVKKEERLWIKTYIEFCLSLQQLTKGKMMGIIHDGRPQSLLGIVRESVPQAEVAIDIILADINRTGIDKKQLNVHGLFCNRTL